MSDKIIISGDIRREIVENVDPLGNTTLLLVTTSTAEPDSPIPQVELIRGRFYVRNNENKLFLTWKLRRFVLRARPNEAPSITIYKDNAPTELGVERILVIRTQDLICAGQCDQSWLTKFRYKLDVVEGPACVSSPSTRIKGPIFAIKQNWERGSTVGMNSHADPMNGQRGMAYILGRTPSCCCCCCNSCCDNHILKYICRNANECGILTSTLNEFGPRRSFEFVTSLLKLLLSATESEALIEYQGFKLSINFEETLPYASKMILLHDKSSGASLLQMFFDKFTFKVGYEFLRAAELVNERPFYRSLTVPGGPPQLVAFWNPACNKWLFTKSQRNYERNLEAEAMFAIAEDVPSLEKATTILQKRPLFGAKKKKGEPLPPLEQHLLYNFRFFSNMAIDLRALLSSVRAICADRRGAESVLSNDLFPTLLMRIFYRDMSASTSDDPYLLDLVISVGDTIALHSNDTNEHIGSEVVRNNIGKRLCYPLLCVLVSMLTGEGLPRNLLGYVVVIQDAPNHRKDVDVNGIYLFECMDNNEPTRPVFRRIESKGPRLYIYYFNQQWQISFAPDTVNYIASCRDSAASPELAFEYWVYNPDERSIGATGGRDLSLLAPWDVGIKVVALADYPIEAIVITNDTGCTGRHIGLCTSLRVKLETLLRHCSFHPNVSRDILNACAADSRSCDDGQPQNNNGRLYIIRRLLQVVNIRLNGREDGKFTPTGQAGTGPGPENMLPEIKLLQGMVLNLMRNIQPSELWLIVKDLKAGGRPFPILMQLCDIFTASVQTCLRDSEIPTGQTETMQKYPWIVDLKIPVNWGMTPPVAITTHLGQLVLSEQALRSLPLTVEGSKLVSQTWDSYDRYDIVAYLDLPIAFCEALGHSTADSNQLRVTELFEHMSPMDLESHSPNADLQPNVTDRLLDMCLIATQPANSVGKIIYCTTEKQKERVNSFFAPLVHRLGKVCENARNAALVARRDGALTHLLDVFMLGTETVDDAMKNRARLTKEDREWIAPAVPALFRFFVSMCLHVGGVHWNFLSVYKLANQEGYEIEPLDECDSEAVQNATEDTSIDTEDEQQTGREKEFAVYLSDIIRGLHQADPTPSLVKVFKVNAVDQMTSAATCLLFLAECSAEHRAAIVRAEGIEELTLKALKSGNAATKRLAAFVIFRLLKDSRDYKLRFIKIEGPEILQRLLQDELRNKRYHDLHLRCALQLILIQLASNLECATRLVNLDILKSVLYSLSNVDATKDQATFERDIKSQFLARSVQLLFDLLQHSDLSDQLSSATEFMQIADLLKLFRKKILEAGAGKTFQPARAPPREKSVSMASTSSRGSLLQEQTESQRLKEKYTETKLLFRKELHSFDLCSTLSQQSSAAAEKKDSVDTSGESSDRQVAPAVEPNVGPTKVVLSDPREWVRMQKVDDKDEEKPWPVTPKDATKSTEQLPQTVNPVEIKPCLLELTVKAIESLLANDSQDSNAEATALTAEHGKFCGCIPGRKHVMISYAWGEKQMGHKFALDLATRLRSCRSKFGVWLDANEIFAGDFLVEKFTRGVKSAACVVMLLSKAYAESPSCKSEANTAFYNRAINKAGLSVSSPIPIIPVLMDNYKSDLIEGLISGRLYIDVKADFGKSDCKISAQNFRNVVKAIKNYVGPHPDYPRPKLEEASQEIVRTESGVEVQLPASIEDLLQLPALGFKEKKIESIIHLLREQEMNDTSTLHSFIMGTFKATELVSIGLKLGDAKKIIDVAVGFAEALAIQQR